MYKVIQFEKNRKIECQRILFRSGILSEVIRYFYSLKDRNNILVQNALGEIVDMEKELV